VRNITEEMRLKVHKNIDALIDGIDIIDEDGVVFDSSTLVLSNNNGVEVHYAIGGLSFFDVCTEENSITKNTDIG